MNDCDNYLQQLQLYQNRKQKHDVVEQCRKLSFSDLCDDTLALMLLHMDFTSAVLFATSTSKTLRRRIFEVGKSNVNEDISHNHKARQPSTFHHLWKMMFYRQFFAPPPFPRISKSLKDDYGIISSHSIDERSVFKDDESNYSNSVDYLLEYRARRSLIRNLCNPSYKRSKSSNNYSTSKKTVRKKQSGGNGRNNACNKNNCLSLPNRYFHFSPVTPQNDNITDGHNFLFDDNDPPPVNYACASYVLTDPGIDGEIAFLNPFSGSISVYSDISSHFSVDDIDYETAMIENAMSFFHNTTPTTTLVDTTTMSLSSQTFHQNLQRQSQNNSSANNLVDPNQNLTENKYFKEKKKEKSPSQILFGVEDYFNLDLNDYFLPRRRMDHHHHHSARMDEDEVVVDWLGIDTHIILEDEDPTITNDNDNYYNSKNIKGFMIESVRVITNEITARSEREMTCTEVLGWSRLRTETRYNTKYICRVRDLPYFIDVSATLKKVFVVFSPGAGPFHDRNTNTLYTRNRNDNNWNYRDGNDNNNNNMILEEDDIENLTVDENGMVIRRSQVIVQYPFLQKDESIEQTCTSKGNRMTEKEMLKYFPKPEHYIQCQYPVTSFAVDSTGETLIVGTEKGTVEIWNTGISVISVPNRQRPPKRLESLTISQLFEECKEKLMQKEFAVHNLSLSIPLRKEHSIKRNNVTSIDNSEPNEMQAMDIDSSTEYSTIFHNSNTSMAFEHHQTEDYVASNRNVLVVTSDDNESNNGDLELNYRHSEQYLVPDPLCKLCRRIDRVLIPPHLPVDEIGFVTLQYHPVEGSTLYLWKPFSRLNEYSKRTQFEMTSLINLPLSSQRCPQIHYDGKRIIVFGQDHIGMIVLVYQVVNPWDIRNDCNDKKESTHVDTNAFGVANLKFNKVGVQFANHIRHAALGGLEYYDNIFMTCNERFVVLNTKTGNLLDGEDDTGASDGLLIIDLKD